MDDRPATPLAALVEVAHSFESGEQFGQRIRHSLDTLRQRIVTCDRCAVLECATNGAANLIVSPAASDAPGEERQRLYDKLHSLFRLMTEDEEPTGSIVELPIADRSHLALPISAVDQTLGLLFIERGSDEPFGEESLQLLSLMAAQLAGYLLGLRARRDQLRAQRDGGHDRRLTDVLDGVLGQELRSPLTSVVNAAYLLRTTVDVSERHRRIADGLGRASKRIQQLIDNVLDFARGAAGIPVSPAPANLEAICRDVVQEAQLAAGSDERPLELSVRGRSDGHWDARRLAQLVGYLVDNALQHAQPGPIRLALDGEGELVRLAISSRGCIGDDVVPRLFQPFRRGESPASGLGLGLYIVRELARAHGGRVALDCDRQRNETTVTVELPRRYAAGD